MLTAPRPSGERTRCRGSDCGRLIVKLPLENGNVMPIDPEPNEKGHIQVLPDGQGRVLKAVERAAARQRGEQLYISHFATCPNGPAMRKPRRKSMRTRP